MIEVSEPTPAVLDRAARIVREGGVVALPGDTNVVLAADPYQESAVDRVYRLKRRDRSKPLSVLQYDPDDWPTYVDPPDRELMDRLVERFLPGPLNVIAPKTDRVPDHVVSGLETVCVGSFRTEAWRGLARRVSPLAATSANRSGTVEDGLVDLATTREQLGEELDLLVGGEGLAWTTRSTTIVDLAGEPSVFREGDIGRAALNEVRDVF